MSMKWMRMIIPVALAVLQCACVSSPPLPAGIPDFGSLGPNACLPEAILMAESFKKEHIEARILVIKTAQFSHATVVYLYPAGSQILWVWDADSKSLQIKADYQNPVQIARAWLDAIDHTELVLGASFL